MIKRGASLLFVLIILGLFVTFDLILDRPFDTFSIVWFAAASCVLAGVNAVLLWTLLSPLWRGGLVSEVDGTFWILFLALPLCAWLLYVAIFNLLAWQSS